LGLGSKKIATVIAYIKILLAQGNNSRCSTANEDFPTIKMSTLEMLI